MWVVSRVTVLLPFVPVIETTGIFRSASRIQAGGVVRASAIVASQRAIARVVDGPWRAERAASTSRSVKATAASAIEWARSAPVHGKVTIQWPGSDERWTTTPPRPSPPSTRSRRTQSTNRPTWPGQSFRGTVAPSRTTAWRPGSRWPYQVRRRPIPTSTLTTGASR